MGIFLPPWGAIQMRTPPAFIALLISVSVLRFCLDIADFCAWAGSKGSGWGWG